MPAPSSVPKLGASITSIILSHDRPKYVAQKISIIGTVACYM